MSDHVPDLEHIKTSIQRDEYAVDPHAVAVAILAMLQRQAAEIRA